ncbi:MAG: spermidine synthase [Thermoanaerobaculia bacterium]
MPASPNRPVSARGLQRVPRAPADAASPSLPLLASVALLSGAALGLEILWMRLLSIAWWHHFAYMVISLALLGYGASGTLLTLLRRRLLPRFRASYAVAATGFGLGAPASFALAQRVPYSPLEVAWNPGELLGLAAVYLVLAVPFLCAGTAVGLALTRFAAAPGGAAGRVYGADLVGAGAGAAAVIGLLFVLPPEEALLALGAAGLGAAALAVLEPPAVARRHGAAAVLLGVAAVGLVVVGPRTPLASWVEPEVSQYKGLAGALRVPGVRVVEERSSPLGLVTVVASEDVPLRHAPGLSLASSESPPEQHGIFIDADALTAVDRLGEPEAEGGPPPGEGSSAPCPPGPDGERRSSLAPVAYRDWMSTALPYHLLERPEVLVLGAGGGGEVASALYHCASRVDAVELDPNVADLVRERFDDFAGHLYRRPEVRLHTAEARGFAAASERRWDLVQVALLDSFTASAAGTHALAESHLYTVEAVGELLDRLAPGGMLAFTRWLEVPPRGAVKLFATAVRALEERGVEAPEERLLLVRSWKTATLVVKERPFTAEELAAARRFARERWFDLAWAPGMEREEANRFNVQEEPYLHDAARAILAGGDARRRFFERYKFHVEPATDDRPYFFRFFEWGLLPELLALRGRGGTHLLEWGYPVLVATLVQAAGFGLLLIVAPLAVVRRPGGRGGGEGGGGRRRTAPELEASKQAGVPPGASSRPAGGLGRVAVYFGCLGLAFLFVEIAFIQRFTLFLAHPLYAVAVVLAGFLVFAGAGSAASGWLGERFPAGGRRPSAVGLAAGSVALLAVAYTVVLPPLFDRTAGLPQPAKVALALAFLAPLAFAMGMPFPLGLARTGRREPAWVPWAWAVNGCASVVSAVAATLLAIHFGFTAVVATAAALYLVAAWALRGV